MIRSIYSFIVAILMIAIYSSVGFASDYTTVTFNNGDTMKVAIDQKTVKNLRSAGEERAANELRIALFKIEFNAAIDSMQSKLVLFGALTNEVQDYGDGDLINQIVNNLDVVGARFDEIAGQLDDINANVAKLVPVGVWLADYAMFSSEVVRGKADSAEVALRADDLSGAIDIYTQLMKLQPDNSVWQDKRGYVHHLSGSSELAVSDWEDARDRAIANDSCSASALKHLGIYYYNKCSYDVGFYEDALSCFRDAIECDPHDREARKLLLCALWNIKGDHPEFWREMQDSRNRSIVVRGEGLRCGF